MVGKRRPQTSVPRRVNTITAHESCTINHEPRSARGDGAARVTKWRAVPLGNTTRPNAVQSFQPSCRVVTNRASRMQSQIYLNFAEAMPIDGRAQVATLQPHITAAYNFHDFPYFPAFPHFPKNSPFPPFPVKPINQETIPTPR